MVTRRYTPCPARTRWFAKEKLSRNLAVLSACFLLWIPGAASSHDGTPHKPDSSATPSKPAPNKSHIHSHGGRGRAASIGATVYKHMCVFCHGPDGNGGGKAMAYLYPWPRDFRKGVFKHRTTPSGSLPLDRDIYETISRGIPEQPCLPGRAP